MTLTAAEPRSSDDAAAWIREGLRDRYERVRVTSVLATAARAG